MLNQHTYTNIEIIDRAINGYRNELCADDKRIRKGEKMPRRKATNRNSGMELIQKGIAT